MKKLVLMFAAIAAVSLASCGNKAADAAKAEADSIRIADSLEAVEAAARALSTEGRILVRESGTEPLIRVMVEAGTEEICAEHVNNVVRVMEEEGLVVE